jgi:hypothetical protein
MGLLAILVVMWLVTVVVAGALCAAAARGDRILRAQLTEAQREAAAGPAELVA